MLAHSRVLSSVLFAVLLLGWMVGVVLQVGNPAVHLLLIAAVALLIRTIFQRNRATR